MSKQPYLVILTVPYIVSPSRRLFHLSHEEWHRTAEQDRLTVGDRRFIWYTRLSGTPLSSAEEHELVEVHVSDRTDPAPLVHLVCAHCGSEAWWPHELQGHHHCLQCGGVLELAPEAADGAAAHPPTRPLPPELAAFLRQLAELQRREAQGAALTEGAAAPGQEPDFVTLLSLAHDLERVAAALDRLRKDGLEALQALVEEADPAIGCVIRMDEADRRLLVSRARATIEALSDLVVAGRDVE